MDRKKNAKIGNWHSHSQFIEIIELVMFSQDELYNYFIRETLLFLEATSISSH
jgi:hypothetical protein